MCVPFFKERWVSFKKKYIYAFTHRKLYVATGRGDIAYSTSFSLVRIAICILFHTHALRARWPFWILSFDDNHENSEIRKCKRFNKKF